MAIEIAKPNVLVVEGKEEESFFGALMQHLGLQNIQIMPIGGKEKLRLNLKTLAISPGFANVISLGIMRDANANPNSAFQSVCDALKAAMLPAPQRPLISAGDSPRVTVMILPEEGSPGILEDLCLKAVMQNLAMACVEQYFHCLQQQGISLSKNLSKAKVQAFLASRAEAGKRLGEAAQAGYWPFEDKAFEQVKIFLKQISS